MAGFGAGFITPVNTINFNTVFDNLGQKLIDNVAVWATIVAFFVIYIPFAVLARHLDKKDALKVQIGLLVFLFQRGIYAGRAVHYVLMLSFRSFFSVSRSFFRRQISEVAWSIITKPCHMFYGDSDL